ncbi:MAG: glycosyltransferase family 10 [Lachnospiraceae bacterium]|nr:glycosyltransferase family 10 [Lachnospiraceae bacterium]
MKTIKIAYIDFWKNLDFENFVITKILKKKYEVIIDSNNPDYIICSNFGTDYLKYNCPRILYLAEAKAVDFNVYDYGIAFDDIAFGDRYLQYPCFFIGYDIFKKALEKKIPERDELSLNRKFCNTVVSNDLGCNVRDRYFEALCTYKHVDSGGRHKNNLPDGQPVPDKLEFQKQYKFSFAFENSSFPGYVTEKIVDAWAAGSIPLYWGAPDVADYFNPKAFIDCTNMKSESEIIDAVKELDEDDHKYLTMLREPILLPDSKVNKMMREEYLEKFLTNIFDQSPKEALRRNSVFTMWGNNYEHHMQQWKKIEEKKWFQFARKVLKKKK